VNNRDKNFTRAKVERRRAQLEETVLCTMAQRMDDFATVADTYVVQKSVEAFRCRTRIQRPRHRREHVGALIQIDGSDHRWFEDRAARSDQAQKPVNSEQDSCSYAIEADLGYQPQIG
jgi:hypothetical protein